jgi:ribonuclease HI
MGFVSEPVNPGGVACYGFAVYRDGVKLEDGCGVIDHPDSSNNVAEYTACIRALERLVELGLNGEGVTVRSDSQLLINQLNGFYSVRADRVIPLYERAVMLAKGFKRIRFEWVLREENSEADELSRKAYREHISKNLDAFFEKYRPYLATEKQKALLDRLKIPYPPWVSKREASALISEKITRRRKSR